MMNRSHIVQENRTQIKEAVRSVTIVTGKLDV